MAKAKLTDEIIGSDKAGKAYVVQEALGYILGTVAEETPFVLRFGADSMWVRDLGPIRDAMTTGRVVEAHPVPYCEIKDHAIRYSWPWPFPVPTPTRTGGG